MTTRKKANPEIEAASKENSAPARAKRGTKKTAAGSAAEVPQSVQEPKRRTTRAKSPAATHKTLARKPMAIAVAVGLGQARPLFDPNAHHDEIAREAYFMWLNRGSAHGQAHNDWVRAVEAVRERYEKAS